MLISVINHSKEKDEEVQRIIRAINRQINEDFKPYWNMGATLRLEGRTDSPLSVKNMVDMRGEAVIYLQDKLPKKNVMGYHDSNYKGVAFGFVFLDLCKEMGVSWTSVFSHEAIELIGDRQANSLCLGPHPKYKDRHVMYWKEMCDAVQGETYFIDNVEVSNFVLETYFKEGLDEGCRNDYLSREDTNKTTLPAFGINPGGYVGFYDPVTRKYDQIFADVKAETLSGKKSKAGLARRGERYQDKEKALSGKLKTESKGGACTIDKPSHILAQNPRLTVTANTPDIDAYITEESGFPSGFKLSKEIRGNITNAVKESEMEEVDLVLTLSPHESESGRARQYLSKSECGPIIASVAVEDDSVMIAMTIEEGLDDNEPIIYWHLAHNADEVINTRFASKKRASSSQVIAHFKLPVLFDSQSFERSARSKRIVKRIVKFFKVKIIDKVIDIALGKTEKFTKLLAGKIEEKLKQESMQFFRPSYPRIKDPKKEIAVDKGIYLLMIHGIFSSTEGAFGKLFDKENDGKNPYIIDQLKTKYGNRMIAYDHWTISKSALRNAEDLLKLLPNNMEFDIVCHSRGAGVTRALLEHPKLRGEFERKGLKVRKVIFVAGANQGSPLALPGRADALVNVIGTLGLMAGTPAAVMKMIVSFLSIAAQVAQNLPGIESMSPKSQFIKELNGKEFTEVESYVYFRSNFDPNNILKRLIDEGVLDRQIFKGAANDVVVPFEGAGEFDSSVKKLVAIGDEYGDKNTTTDDVWHSTFFQHKGFREKLLKILLA